MPHKEKSPIPDLNPRASYKTKARFYEQHSTQELVEAGHLEEVGLRQYSRQTETLDRETKPRTNRAAEQMRLSLRGAISDEAISVFGQRLLRSARNDTSTLYHAVGVLSHSPLSLRVDKELLTQLKHAAKKKNLPLRTLIRTWLIQHAQEE